MEIIKTVTMGEMFIAHLKEKNTEFLTLIRKKSATMIIETGLRSWDGKRYFFSPITKLSYSHVHICSTCFLNASVGVRHCVKSQKSTVNNMYVVSAYCKFTVK